MCRELVIIIGGVRVYVEAEEQKENLMRIIAQNIRNTYTNKEAA